MAGSFQTTSSSTYITTHNLTTGFENSTHFEDDNSTLYPYWSDIGLDIMYMYLVTDCLILTVAFLGTCFTVYGLYSLIKTDHVAPIYVINLFISDIIQTTVKMIHISQDLICTKILECNYMLYDVTSLIYIIGVLVNICFMVCISAERYVMIAHPVWYRNINTIKTSVCVSVSVWITSAVLMTITWLYSYEYFNIILLFFFFLPYPSVIFFFVGTWRALSSNMSVPRQDQRRIMGILALVLCIYTVLFLPYVVVKIDGYIDFIHFGDFIYLVFSANILIALNPLFDFLLYLFMRRDAKDILRALFFCCRNRHEQNRSTETVTIQVQT